MSDPDQLQEERQRTREAVRIIRRLDEDPEDARALRERDAFLARGDQERATYDRTLHAMGRAETGLKRDRNKRYAFAFIGGALVSMALVWQPLKLAMIADFQSGSRVEQVQVASGDTVILDAGSAIADETDADVRGVTLLAGAGYFDVDTSERGFVVTVDDVTVETLGTAFEVSWQGPAIRVSVAEGAVRVRHDGKAIEVSAGESLRWSGGAMEPQPEAVQEDAIAAWRGDQLVVDGMTVGEVAAIIDRRLSGPVLVMTRDLSNTRVAGRLDLSRPADALRTLAATLDAQVIAVSPLGAVIRR